ncbi:hypothetical protein TRM7615_04993 [Falsiruegeria mediterranea M17]|uniref:Uncharacterized protein n=1 Tax=Falsiruegeria mediterranea M17 TaxID=1200281 RepID=A0A2R8CG88_9RHOB|nr:hypothetical protein TRM7615_04993 [Falsiruegeria mediterranea M17]
MAFDRIPIPLIERQLILAAAIFRAERPVEFSNEIIDTGRDLSTHFFKGGCSFYTFRGKDVKVHVTIPHMPIN